MSNVSNVHDIKPFKAGDKALSGQRLAKVGYKSTKKNPARFKSVAVSVPYILSADLTEDHQTALQPYLIQILENAQDGIIRSLYESKDGSLIQVQDSEISIDACIGFLKAESEGNRLTAELIGQWFDSELAEGLTVVLAQKLSFIPADADGEVELTEAQTQVVDKHLKIHKELFGSLAGGATILAEKQIKGLKNALQYCDERNSVAERLTKRLESMEKKTTEEFFGI